MLLLPLFWAKTSPCAAWLKRDKSPCHPKDNIDTGSVRWGRREWKEMGQGGVGREHAFEQGEAGRETGE